MVTTTVSGAGWATSVAKIGSIAGPFLAGLILSTHLPVRNIFAIVAIINIVSFLMFTLFWILYRWIKRDLEPVQED